MTEGLTYNVKIIGLDKLVTAFEQSPQVVGPILEESIKKSAAILANHTDADTVPYKTGTLVRSFNPAKIDGLVARWFPRTDYARILDQGGRTRPHVILPKNKKALKTPFGIFKKINHPGSMFKPRYYMRRILQASQGDINTLFRNALKAITSRISTN